MSEPDVLVLGAGPAGSAVAVLAAAEGMRVRVVERERFPRDKVCGEFLSSEGCAVLARLGALDSLLARGATRIDSCRVTAPGGRAVDATLPEVPGAGRSGLGVSRSLLDTTLLELARRRGAEVLERREARAPILDGGRVVGMHVRKVGSDRTSATFARVIVAADGRRASLVRALHPRLGDPTRSRPSSSFGLAIHLEGAADRLARRVELHLFDGGYAGLGTIEGGRVNLCLMVSVAALRACGGSPDRLFRERLTGNPALAAALEGTRPVGMWKSIGPLRFAVRRPSAAGALFVGDAAGTVDPFSGEGMSHALRSAEIALPFLRRGVARGRLDPEEARGYDRAWCAAFAPATRRNRWLGRLFARPALARGAVSFLAGPGRPWLPGIVAATRTGLTASERDEP